VSGHPDAPEAVRELGRVHPLSLPRTVDRYWWHLADRTSARSRLKRRGYAIHGYIGPNGAGKSAMACYDSIPSLDFGRPVLSTVRLLDFRNPGPCPGGLYCDDPANHDVRKFRWDLMEQSSGPPILTPTELLTGEVHAKRHPFYVPWRTYQQFLGWRDGDVLADEITGFASSREIKNMPPQVANTLVQLRRRNIVLRWTTPSWGRADTIIREVSQGVTLCVGMYGKSRPTPAGEAPRMWRDNRVFMVRTYDPQAFEEVDARRLANAPHEVWGVYLRPRSLWQTSYDTLAGVTALGWANEAGVCIGCGGERRRSKCTCPPDVHRGQAGSPERKRSGEGVPGPVVDSPPLLVSAGRVLGRGAPLSPVVDELLPAAQEAASSSGSLSLVDALTLGVAEWNAEDPV
jgi:hypothetical protein